MNNEMNHQLLIDDFLNQKIEDVPSRGKKVNGLESGIAGELAMLPILEHHCDIVFRDVVIPSQKTGKAIATEMDYVCVRNGNPILIEVKNWFGRMKKTEDPSKVSISFVNTNGKFVRNLRTNPKFSLGGFTNDFIAYLGGRPKKSEIKRFVVFLRDDLIIDEGIDTSSSIILCHFSDFEARLVAQTQVRPDVSYNLPTHLPSWDYYFDNFDKRWYKAMLLNKTIDTERGIISTCNIHSMVFDKENPRKASLRLRNGIEFISSIDPNMIDIRCRTSVKKRGIGAIILNETFHSEPNEN